MGNDASEISRRLSRDALAVCRRYLSKGRREGAYWTVGDVMNTPGRSLYVRLTGPESGPGAAGHFTDAQSGDHGDLLDLIGLSCGLTRLRDALDEARRFLALPPPEPSPNEDRPARSRAATSSPEAARRLFKAGKPIRGTLAAAYLAGRGLAGVDAPSLRFHPSVFYRPSRDAPRQMLPAMLAGVTNLNGDLVGVHRTWLDPALADKARLATPRRAMGHLLGNGVRFGAVSEVLAAGEGVETMLSLRAVCPLLPAVAALSANHLAALELPSSLKRLYIARERDPAGLQAAERLAERARSAGIAVRMIDARGGDLNDDLQALGRAELLDSVRGQVDPEDAARFAGGFAETEAERGGCADQSPQVEIVASESPSSDREETAPTAF